jgi:hypothetical protein
MQRRLAVWGAIAFVLVAYVFFATRGTMRFPPAPAEPRGWDNPGGGYYALLAEGFLRGHAFMAFDPDPRLAALADPYDFPMRDRLQIPYLWDASYFRGRYHLYFTPLPVILFYVPFRLIAGVPADDSIAAVFFSAWTFIAAVLFLRRALQRRSSLWILVAGLANLLPFALPDVRVYEVAILCGTAFSTTWALALLRFDDERTASHAAWVTLWLALAIAARPDLVVLVVPTVMIFLRHRAEARRRTVVAAAVPIVAIACAYLGYNYIRFGDPRETGVTYQLNYVSMRGVQLCSLCRPREVLRFASNARQYVLTPPRVLARFPYVEPATATVIKDVSWPGDPEEIIGVAAVTPVTIVGTAFAIFLVVSRRLNEPRVRTACAILGGAWLVLFALSTCWWIVSRYTFDFQILMILGSAVCIEEGLRQPSSMRLRVAIAVLAIYSVVVCLLLGFEGRGGSFR